MANAINYAPAFPGWLPRLEAAISDFRLYRKTLGELRALSTRELNDLGLSGSTLRQVARDSVYGA